MLGDGEKLLSTVTGTHSSVVFPCLVLNMRPHTGIPPRVVSPEPNHHSLRWLTDPEGFTLVSCLCENRSFLELELSELPNTSGPHDSKFCSARLFPVQRPKLLG